MYLRCALQKNTLIQRWSIVGAHANNTRHTKICRVLIRLKFKWQNHLQTVFEIEKRSNTNRRKEWGRARKRERERERGRVKSWSSSIYILICISKFCGFLCLFWAITSIEHLIYTIFIIIMRCNSWNRPKAKFYYQMDGERFRLTKSGIVVRGCERK